jgi:hypothetical protein
MKGPAARRFGGLSIPQIAALTLLFWAYATVSAIIYAEGVSATMATFTDRSVFAAWPVRLTQHLLLWPILVACCAVSLRLGWTPGLTRVPAQVGIAIAFALLANPSMWLSYEVLSWLSWAPPDHTARPLAKAEPSTPLWVAVASDFLIKYGFGLALVSGFANYKRLRDAQARNVALEQQVTASRLAALRMQLSPHTLFNLLHLIRNQIGWDPQAAQALVMKLSDLLRRLLSAGERELVPLIDEVRFARLYLELQQPRFAERMSLALPADDRLPDVWVPSLILQPLIENAVVHGLAGHDGPVRIELTAELDGSVLRLAVRNDRCPDGAGSGRNATPADGRHDDSGGRLSDATRGRASEPRREVPREGIGLANVTQRLEAQFGSQASCSAGPDGAAHWLVRLTLPAIRATAARAA